MSRVAARYAKALIDISSELGKLDKVRDDINSFLSVLKNRDFELMVKSPIIKPDKKQSIFDAILGKSLDEITMKFFSIVIRKGREAALPAIAKAFVQQYKKINQISTVKLTTATPMGDDAVSAIKAKLAESGLLESNIDIQTETDEDIIGGFVIEFGDRLYDASVAHKLATLKKEFSSNTYIKGF